MNPVVGIRHPMDLRRIMGNPEHSNLPPPDLVKQPDFKGFRAVVVQIGGRFVQQQSLWFKGQGTPECKPLPFSGGQPTHRPAHDLWGKTQR